MVYFLITGLFLLPFVLNTSQGLLEKKNKWLHPLFFTISVMAILQIGLSWIPLFEIRNYFLFEALTIAILLVVVIALLSYFCFLISINKDKITFSNLVKFNRSSLIITAILLVQLVSLIFLPELSNFSDTTAYMSISSNFKVNGNYFFNYGQNLEFFYRLPTGYFINSVIATNNDFKTPYNVLWPMLTANLFYWAINFYVNEKLILWQDKYKQLLVAFVTVCYLIILYASIFTVTPGNLEMQSLFILIAFILFLSKQGAHSLMLVYAFSIFSTTALMISPPLILIALTYLFFKGRRYELLYCLSESGSLFFLALSVLLYSKNPNLSFVTISASILIPPVFLPIIRFLRMKYHHFDANVLMSIYPHLPNIKKKFGGVIDFYNNHKKSLLMLCILMLVIAYVSSALISYFVVLQNSPANKPLIFLGLGITLVVVIYSIYLVSKKTKLCELVPWITFFNLAFCFVSIILIPTNLFSQNSSSWRMILSSLTIGFYCSAVGTLGILIANIYNDHINFWMTLYKSINIRKIRGLYFFNYLGSIVTIAGLTSSTAGVWIYRFATMKNVDSENPVVEKTWLITKEDIDFLIQINKYSDEQIIKNSDEKNTFLFSYYSDLNIKTYLNNCFIFSYSKYWASTFMNNFISSDKRMHFIEGHPIDQLLYFDKENTVTNINVIIDHFLTQQSSILQNENTSSKDSNIGIYVSQPSANVDKTEPIKSERIIVKGTPDLIILNTTSSYYEELTINKETSDEDKTYKIGSNGYKKIYETEGTAYFGVLDKMLIWDQLLSQAFQQNGVNQ